MKLNKTIMPIIRGQMQSLQDKIDLNFTCWHKWYAESMAKGEDFYTSKTYKFIRSRVKSVNMFGSLYSDWIIDELVKEFNKKESK